MIWRRQVIQLESNCVRLEAPHLVALDQYCLLVYYHKVNIKVLLILLHIIIVKQ